MAYTLLKKFCEQNVANHQYVIFDLFFNVLFYKFIFTINIPIHNMLSCTLEFLQQYPLTDIIIDNAKCDRLITVITIIKNVLDNYY